MNDASDVLGWALTQTGVKLEETEREFSILPAADAAQVDNFLFLRFILLD